MMIERRRLRPEQVLTACRSFAAPWWIVTGIFISCPIADRSHPLVGMMYQGTDL